MTDPVPTRSQRSLERAIERHGLEDHARLCGRTLGRAQARSADIAGLSDHVGRGRVFAEPVADFAVAYAGRTRLDWARFDRAIDRSIGAPDLQRATPPERLFGNVAW